MAANEGKVYFALDGDEFNPDDLSHFLGIEPTSIMRKGEKMPDRIPKFSSWMLSTGNITDKPIDVFEMAEAIINQIRPKKQKIIEAIERFNLRPRLEVVLWFSLNEMHSTPAIGFWPDTVKFLGEIGALIDVDTYKHQS